jgi:hypothetical protein
MFIRNAVAAIACAALASTAHVQLRIVSMNASNSGSGTAGPRAGMQTILSAIGSSVSDDPTDSGNTGIAKPLDVLCLQEVNAPSTTCAQYAALLNSMYGTTSFSYGTLAGATSGAGTQGIIFNSATVEVYQIHVNVPFVRQPWLLGVTSGKTSENECIQFFWQDDRG